MLFDFVFSLLDYYYRNTEKNVVYIWEIYLLKMSFNISSLKFINNKIITHLLLTLNGFIFLIIFELILTIMVIFSIYILIYVCIQIIIFAIFLICTALILKTSCVRDSMVLVTKTVQYDSFWEKKKRFKTKFVILFEFI